MNEAQTSNENQEAEGSKIFEQQALVAECAFLHFNLQGYNHVSMETVAKDLRMSKKTIYKVFRSKEEILEYGIGAREKNLKEETLRRLQNFEKPRDLFVFFELFQLFRNDFSEALLEDLEINLLPVHGRILEIEQEVFVRPFTAIIEEMRNRNLAVFSSEPKAIAAVFFKVLRAGSNETVAELGLAMLKGIEKKKDKKDKEEKKKVKKEKKKKKK